jgi:protein involved in polysaccharide export with SLBB domain
VIAALAFAAAASPLDAQAVPSAEPTLRPGDAVRIQAWRMPDFSGEFEVDATGRLLHPRFDTVIVAGVPLSVAKSRIGSVLDREQGGAQFFFQPLLRVVVEGEVQRPTIDRHPLGTTLGDALAQAGGVTERGRIDRVRLVRGDAVTTMDLRSPTSANLQIPLRSGDRIVVERRGRRASEYILPFISALGTAASIANLLRRR